MIRVVAMVFSFVSVAAFAQVSPPLPVFPSEVELRAEASREIDNDEMRATLTAEASDASAAKVANLLNRVTGDALKTAQAYEAVHAQSGSTNTHPVYDKAGKLTGWRGRSEIRLESRDTQGMSALVGRLQGSLQLNGVAFSVSRELRNRTEDELMAEAIAAFKTRAELAVKAIGAKGYKIKKLAVNASGGARPRPFLAQSAARAAPTPPTFEAGTSLVTVTASGVVVAQ